MLQITKIFNFETAHALHGYAGKCRNLHGHSYKLHVTVSSKTPEEGYLGGTGILMDFKDLKKLVNEKVVDKFDHRLILSKAYLAANPNLGELENLEIWDIEPSAENIILYIKQELLGGFPEDVELVKLVLYETSDSYAEWIK